MIKKKKTDKYYLKNELSKKIGNLFAMPLRSHARYFCRNIDILLKYHDISPISPFFFCGDFCSNDNQWPGHHR